MKKDQLIELKVFGLYSLAAKELDCLIGEVDEVYSWYIDEIVESLKKVETKQVYLKGLGMFRSNPACLPNILYYNIVKYRDMVEHMVRFPKYHTTRKVGIMTTIYENYKKVYEDALVKMDILLREPKFDKPTYHKQKQRLIDFKTKRLDYIYESICRLHEAAQAGSKERRQDSGGDKSQDIKRIQFTR